MAKYLVKIAETTIVTYEIEAEDLDEARFIAEYEAGSDCIVDTNPMERYVLD